MVTLIGGESIGYFLIIEFKDTETTILHQVLSVIRGCAEMKKNKIDLPDETTFRGFLFFQISAGYWWKEKKYILRIMSLI